MGENLDVLHAGNPTVIGAYETCLAKLEPERFVLAEKAASTASPKERLEENAALSMKFMASPWHIDKKDDHATRQTVLLLAFVEPLQYSRKRGHGTPEVSFPFKLLERSTGQKKDGAGREN